MGYGTRYGTLDIVAVHDCSTCIPVCTVVLCGTVLHDFVPVTGKGLSFQVTPIGSAYSIKAFVSSKDKRECVASGIHMNGIERISL